ncbi:MAG: 2-iminobutanoate/2-iminopropanoate deaminase [bacterium]|jgi:2-iminobutanoate/2-iminopropanoate deaminase
MKLFALTPQLFWVTLLLLSSCDTDCDKNTNAEQQQMETIKKIISTPNAPAAIGPYSQAVLAGNTLYCSGQIALNPSDGTLVTGNIIDETTQVLKNVGAVLNEANMDYSDVVKATIFLASMDDYAEVNSVYAKYFSKNPPAREAVAVKTLPKNVHVEISVIAVK